MASSPPGAARSPPSPAFSDDESSSDEALESWHGSSGAVQKPGDGSPPRAPRRRFLSFATDLVSSYDTVKKRSAASVKICDEVVHMLRMRISVEEAYAKGLEKCSNHEFPADEGETAKDALEGLRTDLLNKAVQHRELAVHLQDDVLEPFTRLRAQMTAKHKTLLARMTRLQKDSKAAEERYRRSQARYVKGFRDGAAAVVAALEVGAPAPKLDFSALIDPTTDDYSTFSPSASQHSGVGALWGADTTDGASISGAGGGGGGGGSGSVISGAASLGTPNEARSGRSRRYMSALSDKVRDAMPHPNKDIVQWLLPTDKQRREALVEAAQAALQDAERARRKCRTQWAGLCDVLCAGVRELQHILTDFQGMEERLVTDLQDGLRKAVVFDSSALANQQYDCQKLFKVLESINGEFDLRRFIAGAAAGNPADAANAAANGYLGSGSGGSMGASDAIVAGAILQKVFLISGDLPPPPPDEFLQTPLSTAAVAPTSPEAFATLLHILPIIAAQDVMACLGNGRGRGGSSTANSPDVSPQHTPTRKRTAHESSEGGSAKEGAVSGGGDGLLPPLPPPPPPDSPIIVSAETMMEVLSVHQGAAGARGSYAAAIGARALTDDDACLAEAGDRPSPLTRSPLRDSLAAEDGAPLPPSPDGYGGIVPSRSDGGADGTEV